MDTTLLSRGTPNFCRRIGRYLSEGERLLVYLQEQAGDMGELKTLPGRSWRVPKQSWSGMGPFLIPLIAVRLNVPIFHDSVPAVH